jgi:hypothetical protein
MTRYFFTTLTCLLLVTCFQQAFAQTHFASQAISIDKPGRGGFNIVNFKGTTNKERVLLYWTLDKNQVVDQIEVERSKDEKNFMMTGLVFGTDQPDQAEYLFYEKNKGVKYYYRLKIIMKDRSYTYSPVVIPEPDVKDKP